MTLPKFHRIFNDTYAQNIYWIKCTPEQFKQRYELEFKEELPISSFDGLFLVGQKRHKKWINIAVIWCNEGTSFGAAAHEIFHCAHWILRSRNIHLDNPSCAEAYAYLIQSITNQILKKWKFRKDNL